MTFGKLIPPGELSNAEYHKAVGLSASGLKTASKDVKLYFKKHLLKRLDSTALDIGVAVHEALLEKEKFSFLNYNFTPKDKEKVEILINNGKVMFDYILKDTLTKNADKIFGYSTIPNVFGDRVALINLVFLMLIDILVSMKIIEHNGLNNIWMYYFAIGLFVFIFCIYCLLNNFKNSKFLTLNLLRLWLFFGICAMLLNGIFH